MADTVRYNQAILMFDDLEIVCGGFKTSFKTESTDLTATNSSNAYDTQDGKETVEAEASDIDPALRKPIKALYDKKVKGTLASYDYDEATGNLIEDDVLYGARISELSKENGNEPFSIKIKARNHKKQK